MIILASSKVVQINFSAASNGGAVPLGQAHINLSVAEVSFKEINCGSQTSEVVLATWGLSLELANNKSVFVYKNVVKFK